MKKNSLSTFLERVPWEKFLLLWFLAVLMGTSLLWLHYGFTTGILVPFFCLLGATAAGLLWGTTRPRWEKAHCSWCSQRVNAAEMRYDEKKGWVMIYRCPKCGHVTEKFRTNKKK